MLFSLKTYPPDTRYLTVPGGYGYEYNFLSDWLGGYEYL
jgi:hypothetical protein